MRIDYRYSRMGWRRAAILPLLAVLAATLMFVSGPADDARADAGTVRFAAGQSPTVSEGNTAFITVTRTCSNPCTAITVGYEILPGSGTNPQASDLAAPFTGGSVSFSAGPPAQEHVSERTIDFPNVDDGVTAVDDAGLESAETFTFHLTTTSGGSIDTANDEVILTVTDNDAAATISFSLSASSANEGSGQVKIQVVRNGTISGSVSTQCSIAPGGPDPTDALDYTATSPQTITFANQDNTPKFCTITSLVSDGQSDSGETLQLTLSGGAAAGTTVHTLTINDAPAASFSFDDSSYEVAEDVVGGKVTIVVVRSTSSGSASVQYATEDGTALAGSDYTGTSGTLVFNPGDTQKSFDVTILNDGLPETLSQTFKVNLTSPIGAGLGSPNQTTVSIIDDETDDEVTITSLSPASGPPGGGNSVIITGTGFEQGCDFFFGATEANWILNNENQVTAVAPAHALGTVDVSADCQNGISPNTSADNYTYTAGPTITNLSPSSGTGAGNTSVQITGTNFVNVTDVNFGTTDAIDYVVNSPTQITAISPPGAAGVVRVSVTTTGGTTPDTAADDYTYNSTGGIPTITSLTPANTPINTSNTTVTIVGTNLLGATSVTFGGTAATIQSVAATQIVVTAPSRATAGTVEVVVTVPNVGSNTTTGTQNDFTYGSGGALQVVTLYVRWSLLSWQGATMSALAALQGNDGNASTNDVSGIVTAIYWWNAAGTGCPSGQTQCWFAFFPDGVNIPGANDFSQLVHNEAYWFANGSNSAAQWTYLKQ